MDAAVFLDLDGTLIFHESDLKYWNIPIQKNWISVKSEKGKSYFAIPEVILLLNEIAEKALLFIVTGRDETQFLEVKPLLSKIPWSGIWGNLGETVLDCKYFTKKDYYDFLSKNVQEGLALNPDSDRKFSIEFSVKNFQNILNMMTNNKKIYLLQTSRKRYALLVQGFGKQIPVQFIKTLKPEWIIFSVGDMSIDIPMLRESKFSYYPSYLHSRWKMSKINYIGPEFTCKSLENILTRLKLKNF